MEELNLKLSHIKKSYGKTVLEDISLEISNESFITILGSSGAGKSTFLNILGLIEDFDEGEYLFNNISIQKGKDYGKFRGKNIGFIFQSYHLIPTMTCRENIELPLLYCNRKRGKMNLNYWEMVSELGIETLLDLPVNVLSGGEKQRVAIARALVCNPSLIIADEPTGNLDESNKWIVFHMLERESKKGRAVVIITHDRELAEKSKNKCLLSEGKLHEF